MRTAVLTVAYLLLIAACAPGPDATAGANQTQPLDQPFTLAPGASATIGADQVSVRFDRVLSDSRCPRDAQCIAAGEAVLRVSVAARPQAAETIELRTTPEGSSGTAGGYRISVTGLVPEPETSKPTAAEAYRATFVLSRVDAR